MKNNSPNAIRFNRFRQMMVRRVKTIAILLPLGVGAMTFLAPPAWAFGCQGHEIIALIAEKHLSAHAQAMVQELLKDNPIDSAVVRYCKQPDLDSIAYSATWADDYRSAHRETESWHWIDIPIGVTKVGDLAEYCPKSLVCLPQALKDQIAILRASGTDPQARATALRFVIHFVGDIHAPLHTANNNDLGANCVPVTFFGEAPKMTNRQYESYSPNLHQMWDYGIYQREFSDKSMPQSSVEYKSGFKDHTVLQTADELDHQFAAQIATWMAGPIDEYSWTWESFALARDVAYGKLPVAIPVEKPIQTTSCAEDDHMSTRMLKLNEQLGQPYEDVALPIFERQVAKAGARLALVLNQIWP